MPAMIRLSVVLILLMLLGLSAPASADPPCLTTACIRVPDPTQAPGCDPVEFTGGQPKLTLHPFLNMVNIDLSCLAVKIPL